uniref:Uncharacterized protein n=1 Tax=Arundo donax TaxID=35708 RepID=A0A0A9CZI0_ARUDO
MTTNVHVLIPQSRDKLHIELLSPNNVQASTFSGQPPPFLLGSRPFSESWTGEPLFRILLPLAGQLLMQPLLWQTIQNMKKNRTRVE